MMLEAGSRSCPFWEFFDIVVFLRMIPYLSLRLKLRTALQSVKMQIFAGSLNRCKAGNLVQPMVGIALVHNVKFR